MACGFFIAYCLWVGERLKSKTAMIDLNDNLIKNDILFVIPTCNSSIDC